jgi:hypothetical protein
MEGRVNSPRLIKNEYQPIQIISNINSFPQNREAKAFQIEHVIEEFKRINMICLKEKSLAIFPKPK